MPDLDKAMDELGVALSLDWCHPQEREQAVWSPSTGATTVHLRFTYSANGPQRVELLQGEPGSVWDGTEDPGLHHVGLWSDNVAAETASLVDAGWTLRLAQREPADGLRRVHVRPTAERAVGGAGVDQRPADVRALVRRRPVGVTTLCSIALVRVCRRIAGFPADQGVR